MKNKNNWLKTKKFKRRGDWAKATKIIIFLKLQFVFLFENSGFKDVKINETVDFEKLYKMRKVQ